MLSCFRQFALQASVTLKVHGRMITNARVGQTVNQSRVFSPKDVTEFARLTGDSNPIHLNSEFAKDLGIFKGPIVHGALIFGFVSGILGTKLPGPGTVAFSIETKFPNPLYINERMDAEIEVVSVKKRFVECGFRCMSDGKTVMTGKAVVLIKA